MSVGAAPAAMQRKQTWVLAAKPILLDAKFPCGWTMHGTSVLAGYNKNGGSESLDPCSMLNTQPPTPF